MARSDELILENLFRQFGTPSTRDVGSLGQAPWMSRPTLSGVPADDLAATGGRGNWFSRITRAGKGAAGSAGTSAAADAGEAAASTAASGLFQNGLRQTLVSAGQKDGANALARFAGTPMASGALTTGAGLIGAPLAGLAVDKLNIGGEDSNWDRFASGATTGAISGGVAFGPWGALIGGGLLGGARVLMHELSKDDDNKDEVSAEDRLLQLSDAASRSGVSSQAIEAATSRYRASVDMGSQMLDPKDKNGLKQLQASALTQALNELLSASESEAIEKQAAEAEQEQHLLEVARSAAYQNLMVKHLGPYADQIRQSSNASADSLAALAGSSSGYLAPLFRAQAAQERAYGDRMASGMMAAAAVEPWLQTAARQNSAIAQQSQQILAQAMAQATKPAGNQNLDQLLAGL